MLRIMFTPDDLPLTRFVPVPVPAPVLELKFVAVGLRPGDPRAVGRAVAQPRIGGDPDLGAACGASDPRTLLLGVITHQRRQRGP
jgi:hypothetical protein